MMDLDSNPDYWVEKLSSKLSTQNRNTSKYENYFDGVQPLAVGLATKSYRKEFDALLRCVTDNWMPLVVEAVAERLAPVGFRFGDDTNADKDAQLIWQRNHLDADSKLAHLAALTTGVCPVMVWAGDDGEAEITVEHPGQVYVAYEAGSRRRRFAAYKEWQSEWDDSVMCNLYTPTRIFKFVTDADGMLKGKLRERSESIPNPLGVVPVVEIRNRLRLRDSQPRSELMEVLSTQDQINKTVVDMLVAAEFGAFRQKWATGVDIPEDDAGNPVGEFAIAVNRLLSVPAADARFGDFQPTDLNQYVSLIESRVLSIARRTRTPPHYMLGQAGVFPSGESIKSAETGLVAKVRDRHVTFGETWEEVIRLAFLVENDTERSKAHTAETIWADPESRTESEHVDATMKKKTLGVPTLQLWEDLGYTPATIERFRTMLLDEALLRVVAEPVTVGSSGEAPVSGAVDAVELKAKADALGALIRAGVSAESAAAQAGLTVDFTGATPVSLRLPDSIADKLETK